MAGVFRRLFALIILDTMKLYWKFIRGVKGYLGGFMPSIFLGQPLGYLV